MTDKTEKLEQHLAAGIEVAKGVNSDFVYITVGDAKRVLRLIGAREPKIVQGLKLSGHRVTGYCPNCTRRIDRDERLGRFCEPTNFCPTCGQAIKWE